MAERASRGHAAVHHEERDVNVRAVFAFGAAMIVAAAVIHLLVWLLFVFLSDQVARRGAPQYPLAIGQENRLPPEPRLQANPREELRELRTRELTFLETYGWVDKNAGIVHIPIDEAMKRTLERGLPARPAKQEGKK